MIKPNDGTYRTPHVRLRKVNEAQVDVIRQLNQGTTPTPEAFHALNKSEAALLAMLKEVKARREIMAKTWRSRVSGQKPQTKR